MRIVAVLLVWVSGAGTHWVRFYFLLHLLMKSVPKAVPESADKNVVLPSDADKVTRAIADKLKGVQEDENDELMGQIER